MVMKGIGKSQKEEETLLVHVKHVWHCARPFINATLYHSWNYLERKILPDPFFKKLQ